MSRQLPLKRKLSDNHQPEMKKTKLANSTQDHPAPIGAGSPYGGQKTNLTSYSNASAKEKEVDDFLASITAKSPHSTNGDEEDDEMDALIRSSYGPQPQPSAFGQRQPPQPLSHGQQYAHSSSYDQQSRPVSSYGQQPLPSPFGRQQPQSSPNVQHSRPVSSYGHQSQPSSYVQQQRQLPPSRQQHEVQSYHGRKRSHPPPRPHPRRNPAPIGDGPMQEHIELGQPDTDEDMVALLRSLCPENLEGQKCKQSGCTGLKICPGYNRLPDERTCHNNTRCGLVHVRTTCKAIWTGKAVHDQDCSYGHSQMQTRRQIWELRREEGSRAAVIRADQDRGHHEVRRQRRLLGRRAKSWQVAAQIGRETS